MRAGLGAIRRGTRPGATVLIDPSWADLKDFFLGTINGRNPKKFLNKRDKPDITPIAFASAVRGVGGF